MRINWFAVVISAFLITGLRYLWFDSFTGTPASQLIGHASDSMQADPRSAIAIFVTALAMASGVTWVVGQMRDRAIITGLAAGLFLCIACALTAMTLSTGAVDFTEGGDALRAVLIGGGFLLAAYAIAGVVAGAMTAKVRKDE